MKVLMITGRADHGGGPEHLYQIIRDPPADIDFYLACPKDKPYWERYHKTVNNKMCEIPHRRFTVEALYRVVKFVQANCIDIIHSHGKGAGVYGRLVSFLTGIPCVHTFHGIHLSEYGYLKKRLYILYERFASYWTKYLIFVSESERKKAEEARLDKFCSSRIIKNGVTDVADEIRQKWRRTIRAELEIKNNKPVIATLSRFDFQKNMNEAYEIAARLSAFIFIWVGHGPEFFNLKERAIQDKVANIIFVGASDIPRSYLAAADLYLSTSRWEGLPLAMLEAMSVGLPIVATNVVGNRDAVIDEKNGVLYPLGKIDEAVQAIKWIAENNEILKRFSLESLSLQRTWYSVDTMREKTYELYQEAIDK